MTSKIEWTNETWNPVTGCSKVSEGCKHCYAEREWARLSANPKTVYHGRKFTDVMVHPERLDQPLRWKKPRMIFVNSMSDLFHESVPFEEIDKVFAAMALTPRHTYQILTKRPERMRDYFKRLIKSCRYHDQSPGSLLGDLADIHFGEEAGAWLANYVNGLSMPKEIGNDGNPCDGTVQRWPLPNVWLGVSVEDQKTADERIPLLLETPAAVRFVSYEPALGPVDLPLSPNGRTIHMSLDIEGAIRQKRLRGFKDKNGNPMKDEDVLGELFDLLKKGHELMPIGDCPDFDPKTGCPGHPNPSIDWVIAGGESGPKARPSHPDWFRKVRDQCQAAGVPFFFKQWGEWAELDPKDAPTDPNEIGSRAGCEYYTSDGNWDSCAWDPSSICMKRYGKKRAGRNLDGREWNEYPGGGV